MIAITRLPFRNDENDIDDDDDDTTFLAKLVVYGVL